MRSALAIACLAVLGGCAPAPAPTGPIPATWTLRPSGIAFAGQAADVSGLVPEVILGGRTVPVSKGTLAHPGAGTDALGPYTETDLTATEGDLSVKVVLRDRGRGEATVRITATRTGGSDPGLEGFGLGPATVSGASFDDLLVEGYQSWSATYDGAIEDLGKDTEASFSDIGDDGDDYRVDDRVSWWVTELHAKTDDLLLGATSADRFKTRVLTYVDAEGRVRVHLESGGMAPPVPLPAGVPENSERYLLVARPGAGANLATWAHQVARWQPTVPPPFIPVGWNSWNVLFGSVTEGEIDANAAALRGIPGLAPNDLQIDDGWERAWGDWRPNAKFASGLAPVAARLAHQGLHPGVWMAPFLATPTSPVITAHPGWRLVDARGKPVVYPSSVGPMAVLDTSIPAAEDWVVGQVQDRLDEGFRYLKLDFLFAGAMNGVRASGVTAVAAYRHTMARILSRAKSAGAYVLACGAPLLPTAGLANGIRVSSDISLEQVAYSFTTVKNALRNVAYRSSVNAFLAADPDAVRLKGLDADEQRAALTAALLTGRIFALGDDLPTLGSGALGRIAKAVSLAPLTTLRAGYARGYGARPATGSLLGHPIADPKSPAGFFIDPSYPVPDTWSAALAGGAVAVATFDFGDAPVTREVDLTPFGWTPGRKVEDAWAGRVATVSGGRVTAHLPAHGVVLWILR